MIIFICQIYFLLEDGEAFFSILKYKSIEIGRVSTSSVNS